MSKIYQKNNQAKSYDKARLMPNNTMHMWIDVLVALVPPNTIKNILDLGCGTGRFSFMLSEKYDAMITAIDPSIPMLNKGKKKGNNKNIVWQKGTAEDIPLDDNSINLVWMSQVFHHIDNIDNALKEIYRILAMDGYLAVRNGLKEHIDEIIWYQCFPEALEIERKRLLTQEEMVKLIIKYSFKTNAKVRVYQYFAKSYHDYIEKISKRGLSSLIAISDQAFNRGLKKLKEWAKDRPHDELVYEPVDLLIFQKR